MASIFDLTHQLADVIGMQQRAIEFAADDLHRAGMVGALEDEADSETLARLLIACIGDLGVLAPHLVVTAYWDLPLLKVEAQTKTATAESWETLPHDAELAQDLCDRLGSTFGAVLTSQIAAAADPENALYGFGGLAIGMGVRGYKSNLEIQLAAGDVISIGATIWFQASPTPLATDPPAQPVRISHIPREFFDFVPEILSPSLSSIEPSAVDLDDAALEEEISIMWGPDRA